MFNELFWMAAADAAQGTAETTGSFGQGAVYIGLIILLSYYLYRRKHPKKARPSRETKKLRKTEQSQLETQFGALPYHAYDLSHCGGLSLPDCAECNAYCNPSTLLIVDGKQQFAIPTNRILTVKLETETDIQKETYVTTFYKYVENKPRTFTTVTKRYYLTINYIKKNGQVGYIYLQTPADNREATEFAKNCAPYCNGTVVKTEL